MALQFSDGREMTKINGYLFHRVSFLQECDKCKKQQKNRAFCYFCLSAIMATVIPPPSKRQKREAQKPVNLEIAPTELPNVTVRFQASDSGDVLGGNIRVPATSTDLQLEQILNQLLKISITITH